jgi:serine O-acetyltransferase
MTENEIDRVAQHLTAQREMGDAVAQAVREGAPDPECVREILDRIRAIVFDRSSTRQLRADLEVLHGLVAALIGRDDAGRLIDKIPDIRHCVAMDLQAAFDGDPAANTYAEIVAAYPSTLAVSTYRVAHAFYQLGHRVVARIMSESAKSRTGIDIHPGASIGCHFFIDHGTGVVIGETTTIGNRVKLYHGVTLGAFSNRQGRSDIGRKRHPTLEDDVTIYPNATILGGDTVVGARCVVGGNVWLTHSLPPDTRVAIEPPQLQLLPSSKTKPSDEPML